jgi:hypothetical protein
MDDQDFNEIHLGQQPPQPPQPARGLSQPVSPLVTTFVILLTLLALASLSPSFHDPTAPYSNVARVRGDMRTITIALETYFLDHQAYPAWSAAPARNAFGDLARRDATLAALPTFALAHGTPLQTLTTPTAYVTSYFDDPFAPVRGATFCYWHAAGSAASSTTSATAAIPGYILWSPGPDNKYDLMLDNIAAANDPASRTPSDLLVGLTYDPSNGVKSGGDVYRYKQ